MVSSVPRFVRIIFIILIIVFVGIAVSNISAVVSGTGFSDSEWNDWMNGRIAYNVDVKVTSGHAWQRHGDVNVNSALRCAVDFGVEIVLSENESRDLHLLCKDDQGNEYVIIISKIRKSVDKFRNATAYLKTAFKLEHGATIGSYIQNEVVTAGKSIIVRLRFAPGELFFMPY